MKWCWGKIPTLFVIEPKLLYWIRWRYWFGMEYVSVNSSVDVSKSRGKVPWTCIVRDGVYPCDKVVIPQFRKLDFVVLKSVVSILYFWIRKNTGIFILFELFEKRSTNNRTGMDTVNPLTVKNKRYHLPLFFTECKPWRNLNHGASSETLVLIQMLYMGEGPYSPSPLPSSPPPPSSPLLSSDSFEVELKVVRDTGFTLSIRKSYDTKSQQVIPGKVLVHLRVEEHSFLRGFRCLVPVTFIFGCFGPPGGFTPVP